MQLHRVVSGFEMCVSSTGVICLCLLLADGIPGNGMMLYGVLSCKHFFLNANRFSFQFRRISVQKSSDQTVFK